MFWGEYLRRRFSDVDRAEEMESQFETITSLPSKVSITVKRALDLRIKPAVPSPISTKSSCSTDFSISNIIPLMRFFKQMNRFELACWALANDRRQSLLGTRRSMFLAPAACDESCFYGKRG